MFWTLAATVSEQDLKYLLTPVETVSKQERCLCTVERTGVSDEKVRVATKGCHRGVARASSDCSPEWTALTLS